MLDVTFDFRRDSAGRDPDNFSPTLRQYHKALWSKSLPGGLPFELDDATPGTYLHHRSALGEFVLGSDSVVPTFSESGRLWLNFRALSDDEQLAFETLTYTIGGMMLFPANRIGRQMTINGARGCHPRIRDRFDLTIECIRRQYRNDRHPLSAVLARYADFFALFENFHGFVDFFLLQDLVSEDYSSVRFFLPLQDFAMPAIPSSMDAYRTYWPHAVDFVESRNRRIRALDVVSPIAARGQFEA
jgi:hypothetical protein